jgi:hypothetical protein
VYKPFLATTGASSLAFTGFNGIGLVVTGLSLLFLGLGMVKLVPRRGNAK